MAYIETPYGLRYNDDGSLCMTIRQDDVPFPGVDSWAVEEGTTNLAGDNARCDDSSLWSAHDCTISTQTGDNPILHTNKFIRITFDRSVHTSAMIKTVDMPIHTDATTLTSTIFIRLVTGNINGIRGGCTFRYTDNSATDRTWASQVNPTIQKISSNVYKITTLLEGDSSKTIERIEMRISCDSDIDTTFDVFAVQYEAKPYATSFVDGTRATLNLRLFDNETVRSWANSDVVISLWTKRNAPLQASENAMLFSCTQGGGFNIEHLHSPIRLQINDGGTYNPVTFSNPNIFNDLEWHYVVAFYDSRTKIYKGYVDGIEQATVHLTTGLAFHTGTSYKLAVGGEYEANTTAYPWNGLISNFYVGHYRDKNGNVIWTDDFIREVYESKAPIVVAK